MAKTIGATLTVVSGLPIAFDDLAVEDRDRHCADDAAINSTCVDDGNAQTGLRRNVGLTIE